MNFEEMVRIGSTNNWNRKLERFLNGKLELVVLDYNLNTYIWHITGFNYVWIVLDNHQLLNLLEGQLLMCCGYLHLN